MLLALLVLLSLLFAVVIDAVVTVAAVAVSLGYQQALLAILLIKGPL